MTRKTANQISMAAYITLLLVLNMGERSWLPPAGLNNALRRLTEPAAPPKGLVAALAGALA